MRPPFSSRPILVFSLSAVVPLLLTACSGSDGDQRDSVFRVAGKFEFELLGDGVCSVDGITVSAKTHLDCETRCLAAAWDCHGYVWDPVTHLCEGYYDKPDTTWHDPSNPNASCYVRDPKPGACGFPLACPTYYIYSMIGSGRCAYTYVTPPDDPSDLFGGEHPIVPLSPRNADECETLCIQNSQCLGYSWKEQTNWCQLHNDEWPWGVDEDGCTECHRLVSVEWRLNWADCEDPGATTEQQYRCFVEGSDEQVADEQCERLLSEPRPEVEEPEERACECFIPEEPTRGEVLVDCEPGQQLEIGETCAISCGEGYSRDEGLEDFYLVECDDRAELSYPDERCEPDADWLVQSWGPCVGGIEQRDVQCVEIPTGTVIGDSECPAPIPQLVRACEEEDPMPMVECCSSLGYCTNNVYLDGYYCCGGGYYPTSWECCHTGHPDGSPYACPNTPDSGGTCDELCDPYN